MIFVEVSEVIKFRVPQGFGNSGEELENSLIAKENKIIGHFACYNGLSEPTYRILQFTQMQSSADDIQHYIRLI
jgi:hypothetical protein